ncbi:S9 family peptidase [Porphyromonas sp.]|uniref:S9 family peptidase n=1 Tax=Porphyromonas sp. TaxID=1924944 RepID=UPI0026DAE497|nr:S9 family peptidase [Porphyromonas sp.]MDO4770770.1 DPP IV N-terminal domain-containing protein [Porphyromonas sp.]
MNFKPKRILTAMALMCAMGLTSVFAQQKKALTLDDFIPGGKGFAEKMPKMLSASAVTDLGVIYKKDDVYLLIDKQGKERDYLTLEQWKSYVGQEADKLPHLSMNADNGALTAMSDKVLYILDTRTGKPVQKYAFDVQKFGDTNLSVAGKRVALIDGKNISILDAEGNLFALTTDGTDDIVYGTAAHRNEFGTKRGTLWSPSGRYLAYYRIDRTNVEAYPIVDMNAPIAKLVHYKYPMAGRASESVTVHIYDTATKTTQVIKSDLPKDAYFTNWAWSPDEKLFYIDEVERSQSKGRLVTYDPTSGEKVAVLMTEEHPRYVEPSQPLQFVPNNPKLFVRANRLDGYNHIYLLDTKGRKIKQLTGGDWEVIDLIGADAKGKYVYYVSNEGHHMGQALWRVAINNGKRECLTSGKGYHSTMISPDKSLVLDNFSNIDTVGELRLVSTTGKPQSRVIDTAKGEITSYDLPTVELGTIKAADGKTDLYYKMTRPRVLEAGKKYPVIVYVYAGPHAQLVIDSWRGLHQNWDNYMAQEGYIVFTVDSRGSAHRGMEFESVTHRNLGKFEMEDQMKGVEYLKSLPYVDADRIGVHGWSFGGFMTTNLMLTHSDIFKVGVAGGPVMDWSFYEIMYGERYMGTPQNNPEGYAASNLINRAGDLKGRLLLIHGDIDPVVVWQHSLLFVKSAVTKGSMPDYMVYPGHEHNVRGRERVHLYKTITRYFTDHL